MPWIFALLGIGIAAAIGALSGENKPKETTVVFIGPRRSGKTTLATLLAKGTYPPKTIGTAYKQVETFDSADGVSVKVIDTRGSEPGASASILHDEWKKIAEDIGDSGRVVYVVSASDLFDASKNANVVKDAQWVRRHLKRHQVMQVVTHLDSTPLRPSEGFSQLSKVMGDPIWSGNLLDEESALELCTHIRNSLKSEK